MNVRKIWYLFLFISFITTTTFFNNCSPGSGTDEAATDQSSEQQVEMVTDFSGKLTSRFDSVSSDGKTYGYAYDTMNKKQVIKVIFYAGGPVGTGTYVGETIAKEAGVGANAGHYFSYKVPAAYADGTAKVMYAYAHEARPEYQLSGSPKTYTAYTPKAETFYNANIAPTINSQCVSCHSWTISALYYAPLMTPSKASGGSATNNKFIRKMSGAEGHNGGVFCNGGINSGLCASIQSWWTQEFN